MNHYAQALADLDRECGELSAQLMMNRIAATEGFGSSLVKGVKFLWRKLLEFAKWLLEQVQKLPGVLQKAISTITGAVRKAPTSVTVDIDDDGSNVVNKVTDSLDEIHAKIRMANQILAHTNRLERQLDAMSKSVDRMQEPYFSEMSELEVQIDELKQQATDLLDSINTIIDDGLVGNESFSAAFEAKGPIQVNITRAKNLLSGCLDIASKAVRDLKSTIAGIHSSIHSKTEAAEHEEGEAREEAVKQVHLWTGLLSVVNTLRTFFSSVPSAASRVFGRIFRREQSTVEDYSGPSPMLDSYLLPEVEIG